MRKLTHILLIISTTTTQLFSQVQHQASVKKPDPIKYIDEHLGQMVGDGVCRDLPMLALGMDHASFGRLEGVLNHDVSADINSGKKDCHQVYLKQIKPGDIISFDNAKDKDGYIIYSHMAVIYKVVDDKTIVIAEQNVGEENDATKKVVCGNGISEVFVSSKIVLTTIDLSNYWNSEFFNNHIAFHRY